MTELANHQLAAQWGAQMQDYLPWLEREDRQIFLEHALTLLMEELTTEAFAFRLALDHCDPEGLAAAILRNAAD